MNIFPRSGLNFVVWRQARRVFLAEDKVLFGW